MKEKIKKYILFYGIEIIYSISIIYFIQYVTSTFSTSTTYQDVLVKIFILFVLGITWLLGALFNKLINLIVVGIYSFYLISQKVYYRGFGSYYRIKTAIGLKDEVLGAKDSALELVEKSDLTPIWILLGITILFYVIYFVYQRKILKYRERIVLKLVCLLVISPIQSSYSTYGALIDSTKDSEDVFQLYKTDYYIYENITNASVFVEKFGLVTYGYKDIYDYINNTNETNTYSNEIETFLNEKDSVININDYTGILEGKNVLFVQAESFNEFALDKDLTPTLWKLKEEGISIEGFNTPALSGSTSDSEFMANTSIIPSSDGEPTCYTYADNTFPVTLAKLFKENGYSTIAVHNNYASYYNRTNMFETLGYDSFYDCTELGLQDESSDSEVGEVLKYIIADANYPLMMYWITYSGHQPYTLDSVGVNEEDVAKIKEKYPNLSEKYVSYIAKNMDLDHALESIINQAEYTGNLDNLVIVFYGDHIVKGIEYSSSDDYFEETGLDNFYTFNNTDLFIYSPNIEATSYNKVSTLLDLLPTISNMYNFSYDEKEILGRDIFDENYEGFFFANYGEIDTDNYRFNLTENNFYEGRGYDLETAQEEVAYYEHMIQISKNLLKIDYFNEKETGN